MISYDNVLYNFQKDLVFDFANMLTVKKVLRHFFTVPLPLPFSPHPAWPTGRGLRVAAFAPVEWEKFSNG